MWVRYVQDFLKERFLVFTKGSFEFPFEKRRFAVESLSWVEVKWFCLIGTGCKLLG